MNILKHLSLHRSIFIKFTLSFIVVGLIPLFALGYLLLGAFSSQVERYTTNNLEQMMLYMSRNANQSFAGYNEISKLMYMNFDSYELLLTELKTGGGQQKPDQKDVITDFMKTIIATDRHIQSASFVRQSDGKVYNESKLSKVFVDTNYPPQHWVETLHANVRELAYFPTHQEQYYFRSDRQVMTFARNLIDKDTTLWQNPIVLGTLYFDVDVTVFDELFANIKLGRGEEVDIVGSDKSIIYSNVKMKIGTVEQEAGAAVSSVNKEFVIQKEIPDAHQVIIGRFSKQDLFSGLSQVKRYLAIVVVACIISLIFMSLAFSRRFSRPIRGIIQVMTLAESGNLDIHVPIGSEDELGQLAHGFNRMTTRLNRFINEAYVAEIKRKQAELNALKSQIRPHYLYNTLEVVRMSAVANDVMPVADMIHSLSNQLKYVLDYGEDMVSIREELGHVENYFHLIRIRFEDTIELETIISSDISPEWGMLKLSIQPLVENAVQHGIRPKGARGKIRISIEKEESDHIQVTVFDDGVGMSESKLQELMLHLDGTEQEDMRMHVGLKNVHDRLQSLFGDDCGLVLNSRPHIGTSVQLRLPIAKEVARHVDRFTGR